MNIITNLFKSSLGRKFIMGATGVALFGFVIGHLLGNLQVFLGAETINRYGALLKSNMELLWGARIGLLVCIGLHIWMAILLSGDNEAARPVQYANPIPPGASFASRTMLMSGLIVLFFILYHLLHFTVQADSVNMTDKKFYEMVDSQGRHDVYTMIVVGFRQPLVSLFYVIAVGLLSLHLSHGLAALFSSLGLKTKAWEPTIEKFAKIFGVLIFVGYISIPIAVLAGWVGKEVAR
jgi:succinate dehydrogenase / fumarate reductase, cytochrome b subunit